jgi:polar amino acid transport system substrate-binding protein
MKKSLQAAVWLVIGALAGAALWAMLSGPRPLVLGTPADHPPFASEENGVINGLDVDMALAVAEQTGRPLQVVRLDNGAWREALERGRVDMVATAIADETAGVAYSDPYYDATPVALILAGGPVPQQAEELKGMTLAAPPGGPLETLAVDLAGRDRVLPLDSVEDACDLLMGGKADGVLLDEHQASVLAQREELLMPLRLPEFTRALRGFAVRADDLALQHVLRDTLSEVAGDGRRDRYLARWNLLAAPPE